MNPKHAPLPLLFVLISISPPLAPAATSAPSTPNLTSLKSAGPDEIKAFFNSADYTNLRRSDAQFLDDVYHSILHRAPDADGLQQWLSALKTMPRPNVVEKFLQSPEYLGLRPGAGAVADTANRPDTTRNPANVLFDKTGLFVNDATAFPAGRYKSRCRIGKVAWVGLQIDNGGGTRTDNTAAIEKGWANEWRKAGFKVGFWGCPRGVGQHGNQSALDQAIPLVQADANLAVQLSAKYHADFYLADVEDSYQAYNQNDPAPALNRVYVEAFKQAAIAAGISDIPKALSSCGRIALDMKPWIDEGWDAMPQAYWNAYAVYQPSLCVDFYTQTGWPIARIHPTIGTFTSEGEKRTVTLQQYDKDLRSRPTAGVSFFLPESYLRNDTDYHALARLAAK
jgi:hypothetical protein